MIVQIECGGGRGSVQNIEMCKTQKCAKHRNVQNIEMCIVQKNTFLLWSFLDFTTQALKQGYAEKQLALKGLVDMTSRKIV